MVGAGVYSVWSAASEPAGSFLLISLFLAALVAYANAMSSARLAILYPESGGTYVYGRERLGPRWGFVAGWGFVVGKTASCAAMASTMGAYVFPDHAQLTAVIGIVVITSLNLGGLRRTVAITKILLIVSAAILLLVIVVGSTSSNFMPENVWPRALVRKNSSLLDTLYGILQASGLLFFAFAGYARIATLGEEVSNPIRTIPRAIVISLTGVFIVYASIGFVVLGALHSADIASVSDPLRQVVASSELHELAPVVGFGALIAALGALLNLLPGVSRTVLAMARRGDLPKFLAHIDHDRALPIRAEVAVASSAILIVLTLDLRNAIALSGVGVLVYYSITNASALTLSLRRVQRASTLLGLVGCLALVACLPVQILVRGCAVLVVGILIHTVRSRLQSANRRRPRLSVADNG